VISARDAVTIGAPIASITRVAAQSVCGYLPAKNEFVLAFLSRMSTHAARHVALIPASRFALRYTPFFTT